MASFGVIALPFLVVVSMYPLQTLQSCHEDKDFATEMSKEGYSWCTDQYDLLYVRGFQRKKQSPDDLRDFKLVKCCQPPAVHREKPYTCTSADWDLSFKKCVLLTNVLDKF